MYRMTMATVMALADSGLLFNESVAFAQTDPNAGIA